MPGFDPENLPDPDDEAWLDELRESGLDEEQIEQAQAQVRFYASLTPEQRESNQQQIADLEMAGSIESRVVANEELPILAALAAERDYNRQLHPNALADLEPQGTSVLKPILIHRHAQGEPVAAHMRCAALLKLRGREQPFDATMDVPMDVFLRLHTMSEARRMMGLPPEQGDVERMIEDFWRMLEDGDVEPGEPRLRVLTGGVA